MSETKLIVDITSESIPVRVLREEAGVPQEDRTVVPL